MHQIKKTKKGSFPQDATAHPVPRVAVHRKQNAPPIKAFECGDKPKEGQGVGRYNRCTYCNGQCSPHHGQCEEKMSGVKTQWCLT